MGMNPLLDGVGTIGRKDQSLGGIDGLLKVQGVAQTNAGRNRRVIEMDGQLLTGFSPRLGLAVQELSRKLSQEVSLK